MFQECPKSKNPSKICEFGIIRNGINFCGIANSDCDPNGRSIVSEMKCCPLARLKIKKLKKKGLKNERP